MHDVQFRPAGDNECAHLALFADMATRRLASYTWALKAQPGQSAFEVGRSIIRNDPQHFTHFSNWRIADWAGSVIGAINTGVLSPDMVDLQTLPEVLHSPTELKAIAAGTCYLSSAAIYPEYQGRGFGKALLDEAVSQTHAAGMRRLTLLVGSFNSRAHMLYLRYGFEEWDRRPFCAFAGSDQPGEWILMRKDISR
jgi:ribosomal protein S18 acetylase RimI-like enzyme